MKFEIDADWLAQDRYPAKTLILKGHGVTAALVMDSAFNAASLIRYSDCCASVISRAWETANCEACKTVIDKDLPLYAGLSSQEWSESYPIVTKWYEQVGDGLAANLYSFHLMEQARQLRAWYRLDVEKKDLTQAQLDSWLRRAMKALNG